MARRKIIPKRVGGVKVPKGLRKLGDRVLADPQSREMAGRTLLALGSALLARGAARSSVLRDILGHPKEGEPTAGERMAGAANKAGETVSGVAEAVAQAVGDVIETIRRDVARKIRPVRPRHAHDEHDEDDAPLAPDEDAATPDAGERRRH